LDKKAQEFLENKGYSAKLSGFGEKFSGGHTLSRHAVKGVSALQIEISSRFRQAESAPAGRKLAEDLRSFLLSLN